LQRACDSTLSVLSAIRSTDLDRPTPCASWTVRDVVIHILGSAAFFAELAEAGLAADHGEDPDLTAGDFSRTFSQEAGRLVAAFSAPGAMDKIMKMSIGELPGSVCAWIAASDVFTHGWDLARATGQPADLEPELAGDAGAGHADPARLDARPGGRGAIRAESRGGRVGAASRPAGCLPGAPALRIDAGRREAFREAFMVVRAACARGHGVIAIAEILAPALIGFPGVLVAVGDRGNGAREHGDDVGGLPVRRDREDPAMVSRDLGLHLMRFVMMEHLLPRDKVLRSPA